MKEGISPRQLDILCNGYPVRFYKRPADGVIYASLYDYSRFRVDPLHTIRVPLDKIGPDWNIETCPIVTAALAKVRAEHRESGS